MSAPSQAHTGWSGLPRQRRAVVFVDIVESVRLMQAHEDLVIARWRAFVHDVMSDILPRHHGRLVKSLGDGMLLEFETVPPAVAATREIQSRIAHYNADGPLDAAIALRAGAHATEVVIDELDIYGSGVNLAARLAGLGRPGQLIVSSTLRDELVDQVHGQVHDLGLCHLKHIDEPVRAFAVGPASTELPAVQADLRPTLAVVPFESLSGDAWSAIGHALADEVNGSLARHPSLRVLSRLSTAAFAGPAVDLEGLRRLLGATYVLGGRFMVLGDKVRVHFELADTVDRHVVWAGAHTAAVEDIFFGQDEIVPQLVMQVGRQVAAQELRRARALPLHSLHDYTLYLGAIGLMNGLTPADFERARVVFEHLAERNPRLAAPHAMLSRWHVFRVVQGWTVDRQVEASAASDHARRALDLDPEQAVALTTQGLVQVTFDGDLQGGRQSYQRSLASHAQDPYTWALLSGVLSMTGDHAGATDAAAQAVGLSPLDPNLFLFEAYAALAAFGREDYESAVRHAVVSLRHNALHSPTHRILVASLWQAGRQDEAREAVRRCIVADPSASLAAFRSQRASGFPRAVYAERFIAALAAAGMPD